MFNIISTSPDMTYKAAKCFIQEKKTKFLSKLVKYEILQNTSFIKDGPDSRLSEKLFRSMIPWYNKLLQSCPILLQGLKTKIQAKAVNAKFRRLLNFLKIALAVLLPTNFGPKFDIRIPCNILRSCKLVKLSHPFLTAENQDFRKPCKMRNFANYNFF